MYRTDGYRIVSDDPMYEIAAFVMDKRYDASNYIKQDINLDLLQNYIRKCRQKGISMSHMAIIIAGYIRLVSQNPHLNRFVINKRIYARNHFCVSFVTLTQTKAGSTVAKVYFDLDDDIFTVKKAQRRHRKDPGFHGGVIYGQIGKETGQGTRTSKRSGRLF